MALTAGWVPATRLLVVLLLLTTACTGEAGDGADGAAADGTATGTVIPVTVDGGDDDVVGLADVTVRARPGDVVQVINGNTGPADGAGEATVVHAFVGVDSAADVPPVFVPTPDGAQPNSGVWGICRGGTADEANASCPPTPDGVPTSWDGQQYWSTGAMLPGEDRDVPLSPDLPQPSTLHLFCALHPELEVIIDVGEEADDEVGPPAVDAGPVAADPAASSGGAAQASDDATTVQVGPVIGDRQLNAFAPADVVVAAGGTVTWAAQSPTPHDLTLGATETPSLTHSTPGDAVPDGGGEWDGSTQIHSGFLGTGPDAPGGAEFSVTFTTPGVHPYACRFHPGMTGTVTVT